MATLGAPLLGEGPDANYAGDEQDLAEVAAKQTPAGQSPGNPFIKSSAPTANPFTAIAAAKKMQDFAKSHEETLASIERPGDLKYSSEELKRLQHAGIYLREGEGYFKFENHPQNPAQISHTLFLHSGRYCSVELSFAILYMFLAIIEYPNTFDNIPLWVPTCIEAICLAFFLLNLYMWSRASGRVFSFATHPGYALRLFVVLVLVVDLVLTVIYPEHPRYTRVIRPMLVLDAEYAAPVRRICRQIIETTWQIFDMLILVVLYILIWAVLGFYFFSNNDDDPYFPDLATSYISLLILMTTANFPDVMMPAYYNNQFACIFFILYMMFGFYFLLNIVLSMVYEGYTDTEKRKYKKVWTHQRHAAEKCYKVAMEDEPEGAELTFKKFYKICKFFRDTMTTKQIYISYRALDRDFDGSISLSEFYHVFDVINIGYNLNHFETFGTNSAPTRWHQRLSAPWNHAFHKLAFVVEHQYFEYMIDFIILINTVFVIVQAAQQDYHKVDNFHTTTAEWIFFSVYVAECVTKILSAGPKLYFSSNWNKFDFTVVFVSFIGIVVQESTSTAKSSQMTVFIRSLRLLRLIRVRKTFRSVVAGMGYMIPKMGRFLAALGMVYYVFAIIGMGLFNNTVSRCSPYSGTPCENDIVPSCPGIQTCTIENYNITSRYKFNLIGSVDCACCAPANFDCGSEYAEPYASSGPPHNNGAGYYQLNNFDDIIRSFVTLFEQMIVNNWFVAMNGHVYMTTEYARIYFILFYFFAVQVVTNIIVSFVIDSFMGVFPILKARQKGELTWTRAYNETVDIGMDEARKILDPEDIDLYHSVPKLVYCASGEITAADIDRILFADEIEEWKEEEKEIWEVTHNNDDDLGIGM